MTTPKANSRQPTPARLEEWIGRVLAVDIVEPDSEEGQSPARVRWQADEGGEPIVFPASAKQAEKAEELRGELARAVIVQPGRGAPPRLLTLEAANSPPKLYDKEAAMDQIFEQWHDLLRLLAQ